MNPHRNALVFGAFALAAGAAACSGADATGAVASAPVSLTLQRASGAAFLASLALDSTPPGRSAVIAPTEVDSIVVTVEEVALLPMRHDSMGMHGPDGMMGPRHDWIVLQVVGGGRIDLMRLPVEGSQGITVAAGDAPPGEYERVRLVIASGEIWLNTTIVTPQGDTLLANTAIRVFFPSGGIMVAVEFAVPEGGGDIPLVFDAAETFAHVLVTGDGRVIVTPVMRHRHGPGPGRP